MAIVRLKPITTTLNQWASITGAPTAHEAIDDNQDTPSTNDGDTSYVLSNTNPTLSVLCKSPPMPAATAIASVKVFSTGRLAGAFVNASWKVASKRKDGTVQIGASLTNEVYQENTITVTPAAGGWTRAEVNDLEFGARSDDAQGETVRLTNTFKEVDFTPAPVVVEPHRMVASQILLSRLHQLLVNAALPLSFMDLGILEDFTLSHRLFPSSDGKGRGLKRWQRLLLLSLRADVDPMTNLVHVQGFDLRAYRALFWDAAQSKISTTSSETADGIARLSAGGTRDFSRDSKAYGLDPSGSVIVEFNFDEELIAKDGMLLEGARTTRIWNSVFKDGLTNWTKINDGVDGATVTLDTAETLFAKTVEIGTRQSVKILTGAATVAGIEQVTNASFGANTKNTLSVWHDDGAGAQLALRVKNETTANWLQSDGSWGASEVNAVTFAERTAKTRDFLHFTMEGTASTLRVRNMGINTGAKISHVYHVQLESGPPSSEIVSASADKTRAISQLKFSNDFAKRILHTPHGYFAADVIPNFNDGELGASDEKMILRAEYDASNIDELFYEQGAGFAFRRTVAGAAVKATKSTTAVRGTVYRVGWRWTGSEGEHDLSDFTLSVFVAGVKGTDAVAGGAPTPPSTMNVWLGQNSAGGKALDAVLRNIKHGAFVPTDAEMARA